jgi:hypothetical protein
MSGSINITVDEVQRYDFIHWVPPRCPNDNYAQVVDIAPNGDFVVIVLGVRRFVKRAEVTAAVRNEVIRDNRGPILPLGRGPWGKPILGA